MFVASTFSKILNQYLSVQDESEVKINSEKQEININFFLTNSELKIENYEINLTAKMKHQLSIINDSFNYFK